MSPEHGGLGEFGGSLGQIRPNRHRTARTDGLALAVSGYAALLPGAGLRRAARCGHQIMLERREPTSRAV